MMVWSGYGESSDWQMAESGPSHCHTCYTCYVLHSLTGMNQSTEPLSEGKRTKKQECGWPE